MKCHIRSHKKWGADMTDERMELLKERRLDYGLSQEDVAIQMGVSRETLSRLENGSRTLTDKMYERLLDAYDRLNPDSGMTVVIDYVRIRFPTVDYIHVVEEILGINMRYMLHEEYGFYGYKEHLQYGNIFVMIQGDKEDKGTLIELRGQGSRQFEGVLKAQRRDWYDFFLQCMNENAVFKRIDLAINDSKGVLDVRELAEKCANEECDGQFRTFKCYHSGELKRAGEKLGMGYTLYIGSFSSDLYFCIYEKDYEQYKQKGIPVDEVAIKNRFEVRVMEDRALHAVEDLLVHRNIDHTVFSIINRYVRFLDADDMKEKKDWNVNERWAWFLGEHRDELKLTSDPKPFSIFDTYQWLEHQVAPSWKMAKEIDLTNGTNVIDDILESTVLTKKHKKIIEQCTTDVERVITKYYGSPGQNV